VNYVKQCLWSVLLLIAGAGLMLVIMRGSGLSFSPTDKVTPSDFLAIVLTALAVLLTAVTVFLAALAFIGWATFEARVKQSAETFLDKRFSEDDPRYVALIDELKRDSLRGTRPSYPVENDSPYSEDAE
jgi:hypothetical protein